MDHTDWEYGNNQHFGLPSRHESRRQTHQDMQGSRAHPEQGSDPLH
jgi:hypothetical protein